MEIVVVDQFTVTKESLPVLLEKSRAIQPVLSAVPGFIEGHVYQREEASAGPDLFTIAVWRDRESLEKAKNEVAAFLSHNNTNMQEMLSSLGASITRSVFTREPFVSW